jgi:two-component system, LytTR family, sensor kinase
LANTKYKTHTKIAIAFGLATLIALTFVALSSATALSDGRPLNLPNLFLIHFTRIYTWAILSPLIFLFVRRYPIDVRRFRWRSLLIHIPALIVFCSIHQAIYAVITWMIDPTIATRFNSIFAYYQTNFFGWLYLGFLMYSLIIIAMHAFLFYRDFLAEREKKLALDAQLAQAHLSALKMQLQPHFLFNTLHSISSLTLEDPPKANTMIARLGDFLRLTLEHSEQQKVSLKEELEFLKCYLEIEQVRFSDRLTVDFEIEPAAMTSQVPHLILQPIVENAVQHGIAPKASQGFIKISAKRLAGKLKIEIRDDGPGFTENGNSESQKGVGLANVRARLKQTFGENQRFEMKNVSEGGTAVILEIPFETESPLPASAAEII